MTDFFKKTWVAITSWVLIVAGVVSLVLGGTTEGEINTLVGYVVTGVGLVASIVTYIISKSKKK